MQIICVCIAESEIVRTHGTHERVTINIGDIRGTADNYEARVPTAESPCYRH